MMNNKFLLLLAFDSLLLDIDEDYESVPEEILHLIKTKVYESYGLTVNSSRDDLKEINALLVKDARKYRDQIIKEVSI